MASVTSDNGGADASAHDAGRSPFVVAIFAGSFLLFMMQPMVARMALPRLGGAPAVWNSAMLVYQALLLAGYGYTHFIGRLATRMQALVHLALLALAALWLPIGLRAIELPADASPVLWVPWLIASSVGPLFLAVSAQAPLIQRWFGRLHPDHDPYALYAASNLGSFAGLLAYPVLVEPLLGVAEQSLAWSLGYVLVAALMVGLAITVRRHDGGPVRGLAAAEERPAESTTPSLTDWAWWVALSAVPSGLILATTSHLTTDVVAMPLIWVVPLGLYLLSFTFAFTEGSRTARLIERLFPMVAIIAGGRVALAGSINPLLSAAMDIGLLFVTAVTLHGALYRRRPDRAHLSAFYLALSVGGVIGGIFCAIVAPLIFDWVYEYPLLVLAAAILVPGSSSAVGALAPGLRLRIAVYVAVGLAMLASGMVGVSLPRPLWLAALIGIALICRASFPHRAAVGVTLAALMLAIGGWNALLLSLFTDARERSYFGVYTIADRPLYRELTHGTTLHGVQRRAPADRYLPGSYYAPASGIGLAMGWAPMLFGPHARIGVVGLGTGTLACYHRPGQELRFYEIDPAVVAIATDPRRFTFLSRCAPDAKILIGDARLTLASQHDPLDLLAVDAFSSDAVPTHLLTLEAFDVYRRTLAPNGLLMIHISNRFMDLAPVLAAAAEARGWHGAVRDYWPTPAETRHGASRSIWVALSADERTLERLNRRSGGGAWTKLGGRPGFHAWTDDHSSILSVLR
jgi:hypothetical protein